MLSILYSSEKLLKVREKFQKYGPYAIKQGLKSVAGFLNEPTFKAGIYPPSQAGSPFAWSSERQRRYVFANVDLPSIRTMELANSGQFKVDERYFTIEYANPLPWWKYVMHPSFMIIGHKMRGWQSINEYVQKQRPKIIRDFKQSALDAWEEMDAFITGGGGGL